METVYNTEILSVGTELLLGHITNTDARDISEALAELGINVRYHTVVGDNPERLKQCVAVARGRANLIITTGGLGPTCDDLTKQTLAEAFGLKLELNEEEYRGLYANLSARKIYTPNNDRQVTLPEGCTVFHNTCGTAPGCAFEKDGVLVIMLPGPPKECRTMMEKSVIPFLRQRSGEQIVSHSVRIFGIGESRVDDIFASEMNAMTNPSMAPYAKECDCLLQITAKAATEAEAEAMCRPVMEHVMERLGDVVYGVDIECVEESAFALLQKQGRTFATAESCTGGDIARRFTELPGSSELFRGGVVVYTNDAKAQLLGIDPDVIETEGAVSYEVACELAENVRTLLGADFGIGVTGIAGPGTDGVHEVGAVFVSLATENETFVRELHLGTHRDRGFIRRMAGNHAFDMLRRYLSGLPVIL